MLFYILLSVTIIAVAIPTIITQNVKIKRNNLFQDGHGGFLEKFQQNDYKVQFERGELVRTNKKFLKKAEIITYKYNRTTAVLNITWLLNVDVNNKTEMLFQAYKFASNEYRIFPIRFQLNFCDAMAKNIIGFSAFKSCGNFTGCPVLKGIPTRICNWYPDESMFPPFIPNGKYMIELQALYGTTELFAAHAYGGVDRPVV